MALIYNTLGRGKEALTVQNNLFRIFVCGPTVYDFIHLGNARTFLVFDALVKFLRHNGYKVKYLQNITDIDNKIIARAKRLKQSPLALAKQYSRIFKEDMKNLGITAVDKYAPASEHIKEVINQVKTLISKGHAYFIENDPEKSPNGDNEAGGYYFDLTTFPEYGKLSGRNTIQADDAVSRIDENPNKRNPGDFSLWKISKPGEPAWDFETGKYLGIIDDSPAYAKALADKSAGRPGWHIEDTAITEKYFGPQYDLHGGGQDLIFPHHEAEITQQESASGKKPFVRYWMHIGFLVNKDQKMSKSLGNFSTLHELLQQYSREVLRFFLLSAHYRSPLDFSQSNLKQTEAAIRRLGEFRQKLSLAKKEKGSALLEIKMWRDRFFEQLGDDFNTPAAFGVLFDFIKEMNSCLDKDGFSKKTLSEISNFLDEVNKIFEILPQTLTEIPPEIKNLIQAREKYREQKNYAEADKLRCEIENLGYSVDDTLYGPLVKKTQGHPKNYR